jgi:broad specificity phosphatase PhoE
MGLLALVRHGQASAFAENYDRLSTLGELQSKLLGACWKRRGVTFDRVFCGPRVRQQRTAEIVADHAGAPTPVMLESLDEMRVEPLFAEHMPELYQRHGHLQTLSDAMVAADGYAPKAKAFARLFGATLHLWLRGEVSAEGVEPWVAFQARMRKVLADLQFEGQGKRIALFTSAGPIALALQFATGLDDVRALDAAFRVRNSSVSEFLFSSGGSLLPGAPERAAGERFSLSSFNETPHLEDAAQVTVR